MRRTNKKYHQLSEREIQVFWFLYCGYFNRSCYCVLSDHEIAIKLSLSDEEVCSAIRTLQASGFVYGITKETRYLVPSEYLINTAGEHKSDMFTSAENFDTRISRHFSRSIHDKLSRMGMRGIPAWSPKCADEIRKLRTIDRFTEKEISDTLNFIIQDIKPVGFCLAKNIRSTSGIRNRWNNGMTKFETAYNAMKEAKLSNPNVDDPDSLPFALRPFADGQMRRILCAPFEDDNDSARNHVRKMTADFYFELVDFPHPNWKLTDQRFLEWEQLCYDISMLLNEFVEDRKWSKSIFSQFVKVTKDKNPSLNFYNSDILREKLREFFYKWVEKGYCSPGRFAQLLSHNKVGRGLIVTSEDDTYKKRIDDFIVDQKNLEPFKNATEIFEVQ